MAKRKKKGKVKGEVKGQRADNQIDTTGTKQCPECGILNPTTSAICEVCEHEFGGGREEGEREQVPSAHEEVTEEREKEEVEEVLWDLNRILMRAISEGDQVGVDATRDQIAEEVGKLEGFGQDEEGYACQVGKESDKEVLHRVEADLKHDETGGPVSAEPTIQVTGFDPSPPWGEDLNPKQEGGSAMENKTMLVFNKEKETKNTVRFIEGPVEGEAPVIGTLYVQRWWIGEASKVTVTIEKE